MKKIAFLAAVFLLLAPHAKAQGNEPSFSSGTFIYSACNPLGFAFYFRPDFTRSTFAPQPAMPVFAFTPNNVYANFSAMRYQYPKGVVFCRMENATAKRYGFMLSIHAGGYTER